MNDIIQCHENGAKIAKKYVNGDIVTFPEISFFRLLPVNFFMRNRNVFKYNWTQCKAQWGKPHAKFKGEYLYHVYVLKTKIKNKTVEFIITADPDGAGKGSSLLFMSSTDAETYLKSIISLLHKTYLK
jgi:hypothetical protein